MDLSIIIVNYNSGSDLERCLASIAEAAIAVAYEVIVVDNQSKDGSERAALGRDATVTLCRNPRNLGFAGGVNSGAARAAGRYLLVLNPDMVVGGKTVEPLMRYLDEHDEVALCAPKLLNLDGTLQYSCRTDYTLGVYLMRRTPIGRWFPRHRILREHLMVGWDHATVRDVDWVLGAALLLRRSAFRASRVMDDGFFLYFEDVDLCVRLRRAGWRVVYLPDSVMYHTHRRASAQGLLSRSKVEHLKSWLRFEWKHRIAALWADPIDPCIVPRREAEFHA